MRTDETFCGTVNGPWERWAMSATSTVWAHSPRVTRTPHSHRATRSSPRPCALGVGHVRRAVGQRGGLVVRPAKSARCHDITVERLELADCWGGTFDHVPTVALVHCRGGCCCPVAKQTHAARLPHAASIHLGVGWRMAAAADCHAEVFTPSTDSAAKAFWRAARVLRWSEMAKREQARKLTEFQPT
jgi:hypothetical protein